MLDDANDPPVTKPTPDPVDDFLKKNMELKEATAQL
jgi:hypothetical protein